MTRIQTSYGHLDWRVNPGGVCEIVDIEVKAEFRGRGFGRRLLETLFAKPEVRACQTVYAITRVDNLVAQQFYEKCMFEVTGILRRFYSREERVVDAVMYGRSPRGPV
jgi:ribosomal protein S18 acetylase RimI-like enzyme